MTKHSWQVWAIYMLLAANLSEQQALKQACPSCSDAQLCNCSSMGLDFIPPGLTAKITMLNLAHNRIKHIRSQDLQQAVNLRALLLQANKISSIDEDSFQSLAKLELLDLSNNSLAHLSPVWFGHLFSLQHLHLQGNFYRDLGESSPFSGLRNLSSLRLGNPRFSVIRQGNFEGIELLNKLWIDGGNLSQYEQGSLKLIKKINHMVINLRNINIFSEIVRDLLHSVTWLEVRRIAFSTSAEMQLLRVMTSSFAKKISFKQTLLTDATVPEIVSILEDMPKLVEVELIDCRLLGTGQWEMQIQANQSQTIRVLTIQKLSIEEFYLFTDLRTVQDLLFLFTRVTVRNTKVFLVPCRISQHLRSLEYLDLSANLLGDQSLEHSACQGGWPLLQTLNLSQNSLGDLEMTGRSLSHLRNLIVLDISQNNFGEIPDACEWPKNLKYLNLSSTQIPEVTTCIPPTLEVLDVSANNLKEFGLQLPFLKELYLTKNQLKTLPGAAPIPNLVVMSVRRNKLNSFSKEEFESFKRMELLDASDNNFICSCEFLSFIHHQAGISQVLVGWPDKYVCDSPLAVRGAQVGAVHLSLMECHRSLMVSLICILVFLVILILVAVGYKYHAVWYLRMTWAWLQAKRKPKRAPPKDICYDAFVSYSENDSDWVENIMVRELEQACPPFRLCLHKRDFVPGKWIVDNIIDSIEKSHKTLFVLSEHFVQSEWCKYELDFSHFRLFDENNDAVILVLLEPIQSKTIPKRFCKLRKIMNTKTYLEWPLEEEQQQMFWFNLKIALKS
ncbi:toll-like receptor 2 [Manacus candei]|uniref:toll-like receptor 2 n=1 Tax=Manacus candei TaxID=415023 RepID=UPI00222629A9|nr:toll-like receptor 2 [Manacus candei]XP_051646492.1 toll-like receptor 2 [Manacus candei]XP_051646493.1 toll-like receptor 2 [Manacus candei]XP_051646494.1 toll-like receptor 2 [Manacus candei]